MKILEPNLIALLLIGGIFLCKIPVVAQSISYPETASIPSSEIYHGIEISDPYQWMEAVESEPVQAWMKSQDEVLRDYINDDEANDLIRSSMERFGNTGKGYSVPLKGGDFYFYGVQDPDFDHTIIHYQKGLKGPAKALLDMNQELKENETFGGFTVCPNGHFMAISIRVNQGSYGKIKLFNIDQKKWYPETLVGTTSANVGWTYDNGFYYIQYGDSKALNEKKVTPHSTIKYHKIRSSQDQDHLVLEAPKNEAEALALFSIASSSDFKYLVVRTQQGRSDKNGLHLIDANNHSKITLVEEMEDMYTYIGSRNDLFYFYTNKNAPNGKVIAIHKDAPESINWKTVVQEQDEVLAGGSTAGGNAMNLIGEKLTLLYRKGTQTRILVFDLNGNVLHDIPLETGWVGSGIVGRANGNEAWFSLNTFLSPNNVYRLDLETGGSEIFFNRELSINREDYVVENTHFESEDGTMVPIYICYKKDLKKDGSNPVFMYGYGFGGWVATPWYQPQMLTFIEMGGIYVLPGIRGGGEYGDAWRDAGINLHRQNAIDDYISAADFLVKEQLTIPGLIVANGWSASGSLAAAASMQRPDLFGAALIGIPSLDMLRYEKFTAFKGWTSGFGSVAKKDEFLNLFKWSPYHNIKSSVCYPPILVSVGEKDPTTPPQHGYKFVAAMQAHQPCESPVLLKVIWGGGHGFGTTSEQTIKTKSQELAFLVKALKLDVDNLLPTEKN